MRSRLIIVCASVFLVSACGGARTVPATQGKPVSEAPAKGSAAMQQLRAQAEKGNVEAQFALAQAYDRGREVPIDKVEAVRWYMRAADQGDAFSQYLLGNNAWNGTGMPKSEQAAVQWWQRAASQGFAPAQSSLGRTLVTGGQGVSPDKTQAYLWLALSAGQGDQEADQQRATLVKQLQPDQLAQAKRLVKEWKPARSRAVLSRNAP
jgi:TPR repeat protein